MSANPMPLRRAVEIVEAGDPERARGVLAEPEFSQCVAGYTRARAILAAAVEAHEATVHLELDPDDLKDRIARDEAFKNLRKLERGE